MSPRTDGRLAPAEDAWSMICWMSLGPAICKAAARTLKSIRPRNCHLKSSQMLFRTILRIPPKLRSSFLTGKVKRFIAERGRRDKLKRPFGYPDSDAHGPEHQGHRPGGKGVQRLAELRAVQEEPRLSVRATHQAHLVPGAVLP